MSHANDKYPYSAVYSKPVCLRTSDKCVQHGFNTYLAAESVYRLGTKTETCNNALNAGSNQCYMKSVTK